MRRGEGWLPGHPERELITRRYLKNQASLFHPALERLGGGRGGGGRGADDEAAPEPRPGARRGRSARPAPRRGRAGRSASRARGGCSTSVAARAPYCAGCSRDGYEKVVGVDVSVRALEGAARRLDLDTHARRRARADRAAAEPAHLPRPAARGLRRGGAGGGDRAPRPAAARRARGATSSPARPGTVVVTTPNAEYNVRWPGLDGGCAPSRPPLRMDARGVRRLGRRGRRAPRVRGAARAGRARGPRGRRADPDGGVQPMRIERSPTRAWWCWSAPRAPARAPSRARHFAPTEVISSDFCRGLVADDENDQAATADAFAVLNFIAAKRLAQPRLTVVDATNVQRAARKPLLELAREHDLFAVAIVLDLPESVCQERNRARPDRDLRPARRAPAALAAEGRGKKLRREGFHRVWVLDSVEEVEAVELRPDAAVDRPARRARALRRDRRRPRLPRGAGRAARRARLRGGRGRARRRRRRRGDARSSSATTATAARTPRRCCAWRCRWRRRATRSACRATTT